MDANLLPPEEPRVKDFGEMTDDEIDAVLSALLKVLPPTPREDLIPADEAFAEFWDEV